MSEQLRNAMTGAGRGLVVQSPEQLLSHKQMEEMIESVISCRDMETLTGMMQKWKQSVAQVKLLVASLNKAASNLKAHVANAQRKDERVRLMMQRESEHRAFNEVRQRVRAAATVIKQGASEVPPLFKIQNDDLQAMATPVKVHEEAIEAESLDCDLPCLFEKCPDISTWHKDPRVQVGLGSFGGKYKRVECFKVEGKAQAAIYT